MKSSFIHRFTYFHTKISCVENMFDTQIYKMMWNSYINRFVFNLSNVFLTHNNPCTKCMELMNEQTLHGFHFLIIDVKFVIKDFYGVLFLVCS
jgi:hypothetical protein